MQQVTDSKAAWDGDAPISVEYEMAPGGKGTKRT